MCMRFFYFFIFCLIFSFQLNSQNSFVIKGEIIEKNGGLPVPNTNISVNVDSVSYSVVSGQKGIFILDLPIDSVYILKFSHQLYAYIEQKVFYEDKKDTIEIKIVLNRSKQLEEVIVTPNKKPDVIFGNSTLSVADFEILKDGSIVLLTYPKKLNKGSELLLWNQNMILNEQIINGTAEELVRDFRGNPHVVCKENVFGVSVVENKILLSTLAKDYFKKYLAPILDTNKSKMFFSNFNPDYPSFGYYSYDKVDSTYSKIIEITDELMMELYRSEYKWVDVRTKLWAKNKELETGIDAEIWVGANYFTQSVYYKQLYAPMFHRNDTLFVLDYYKDQLRRFNSAGNDIDSIPIFHHYYPKETGWKKKLIQDQVTGQIYAVMDIAGYSYIRHLDTETGKLGDKIQLEYRYVEKVEIYNNEVYYIYRPFESVQKKYLYKETLPFNFEKGNVPNGDEIKVN